MKLNVLITCAAREVDLVSAFKDALRREGGGSVIAVDGSPMAAALYIADRCYISPKISDERYINFLKDLCIKDEITLLIPMHDEELPLLAKHRAEFADIGTMVMVADARTINLCQDKLRFIEHCNYHGIKTPRLLSHADFLEKRNYPLFIKPRRGRGGSGARLVRSQDELPRNMNGVVAQEYIELPEYSIDLFADYDGRVISVVPRERLKVFGGESFVSKTFKCEYIICEAERLSRTLGLIGHNTMQCFAKDDRVLFIEVNARYGGASNHSFAAGAQSPHFLIKLLKGARLESRVGVFEDGLIMMRYTRDMFIKSKDFCGVEVCR